MSDLRRPVVWVEEVRAVRTNLIYLGIFLGVVCLASATSLAVTHGVAEPLINEHKERQRAAALTRVLPEADRFEHVTGEYSEYLIEGEFTDVDEINLGYRGEEPVGYVFRTSPAGYADEIVMMIGVSGDEITGMSVLQQRETPGLGARVTEESFQRQFAGLPARQRIATVDDGGQIDVLAGATESTLAVIDGAEQARQLYKRIREER